MSRKVRVLALILLVFLAGGTVFAADSGPKAAWPAYAFTILLGFGSGQYYMGTDGTWFLVGDIAGLGTIIGGTAYMLIGSASALASASSGSSSLTAAADAATAVTVGYGIIVVGSLIYGVSRVWQLVDTIMTSGRLTKEGKLAVGPMIEVGPDGSTTVALSFKY